MPGLPTPATAPADGVAAAVLETLPAGVTVARAVRDDAGVITDFELTYANPAAVRIVGRPREELIGSRVSAWADAPRLAVAYGAVLDTGAPDAVKAGTLELDLLPLGDGVLALLRHLGEREAQLAEAQRIAHFGSWEWDMRTGTVTWSDELFRIYGLTPAEYTPSYEAYLGRVHPDDREHVSATIQGAAQDQLPFSFEERIVRPDGEVRILQSGGGVVVDEEGRPVKMVGACHDVTERVHERAELERRREAERQAKDINDSVVGSLVDAMQALDGGDLRGAQRAMRTTLEHASRIVTELVGADVRDEESAPPG